VTLVTYFISLIKSSLVFDGSRQAPSTYDNTYSPTVRPESIRLFHVFAVEMGWPVRQYDVPQAFLQSPVDHDIFVYAPRRNVEFSGQILKLRLALYGAKQSSALFFKLLNGFLLSLGFVSSSMDACFYKRNDSALIMHVDDMRVSVAPDALTAIHNALFARFKITTGDGTRFLGMDKNYDISTGVLMMGMDTYIRSIMERFQRFDLSLGFPYREIVGCLLWIVMCVVGPDLLLVKDLARHCNNFNPSHYATGLKVLKRLYNRHSSVIRFQRGTADRELVPSQFRPTTSTDTFSTVSLASSTLPLENLADANFILDSSVATLFEMQERLEIPDIPLPTNSRFTTSGYTDAAFAVGEEKDGISGLVIFVNGTPIIWGSMKQTAGADSTCSSEFVAASVCCKQLLHVENMFCFLGFLCPKPYKLYTDSQASLAIASNPFRMGQIWHIAIRYHLVRSMVPNGDVLLQFCVTEDMIADPFTKILSGAAYDRLSIRFYFLGI
jgi:hypothetical protein